ncbi:MAG: RAMP superfamily CRISPR-associated protein [Ignisphaera sp.]
MIYRDNVSDIVKMVRDLGIDHDVLTCITVVEGIAVNETPLRIGKGHGELGEVDLPVVKDHKRTVFIPASSLKGALRSFSEALARGNGYNVCTPYAQHLCSFGAELLNLVLQKAITSSSINDIVDYVVKEVDEIANRRLGEDLRNKVKEDLIAYFNEIKKASEDREKLELLRKVLESYTPCTICRVFGNQVMASRITVFNMYPLEPIHTFVRTRTAIDRFRDAARSGTLFEYEYVPAGHRWKLRIELKNIDLVLCRDSNDKSYSVCRLVTELLRNLTTYGISVGGMKSVGHGLLKLSPVETTVTVYRVKDFSLVKDKELKLSELLGMKS